MTREGEDVRLPQYPRTAEGELPRLFGDAEVEVVLTKGDGRREEVDLGATSPMGQPPDHPATADADEPGPSVVRHADGALFASAALARVTLARMDWTVAVHTIALG